MPDASKYGRVGYLDLSFDKGGDVVLVLKDGEGLQQVMFQPLPVLRDLFAGGSCRGARRERQCTQLLGSHEERDGQCNAVQYSWCSATCDLMEMWGISYYFVFLNIESGVEVKLDERLKSHVKSKEESEMHVIHLLFKQTH